MAGFEAVYGVRRGGGAFGEFFTTNGAKNTERIAEFSGRLSPERAAYRSLGASEGSRRGLQRGRNGDSRHSLEKGNPDTRMHKPFGTTGSPLSRR